MELLRLETTFCLPGPSASVLTSIACHLGREADTSLCMESGRLCFFSLRMGQFLIGEDVFPSTFEMTAVTDPCVAQRAA